jgi:glyoxylase-like metal-dependent hydrolase (beta-lactamase superfamily II)
MQPKVNALPVSEHFELKQLAAGVYAAIGIPGGAAYSNAGIVDLGDQTLIFDTFETPQAARDLKAAAEHLTGRAATCVIISHCHADHWCGNQVFEPQTPIMTTHAIREEMPAAIGWLKEFKKDPVMLEQALQEDQELYEKEADPRWRASREASMARTRHLLAALPTLEFRFPDLTFDGELVFYGTRRTVEVHSVAPGHTASDIYLILPEDRIVFMGDLGFFQCQPFMVFCDPLAWKAHLARMEHTDFETFVPGHGPLGTRADLTLQRQYIQALEELVGQAIQKGLSAEETVERPLPAPFDAWLHGSMGRWEANVMSMHERLLGERVE